MARINLRQQKLSFRNQPIGLIQRSNAVEQSLASTANEVNKLNKIVFDELAQQAKETGEERARSMPIKEFTTLGADGKFKAYSTEEFTKMGSIGQKAFEQLAEKRFMQSVQNDMKLRAKELRVKYENVNGGDQAFNAAMSDYVDKIRDNSPEEFKEIVYESGVDITRDHTADLTRIGIRVAQARNENMINEDVAEYIFNLNNAIEMGSSNMIAATLNQMDTIIASAELHEQTSAEASAKNYAESVRRKIKSVGTKAKLSELYNRPLSKEEIPALHLYLSTGVVDPVLSANTDLFADAKGVRRNSEFYNQDFIEKFSKQLAISKNSIVSATDSGASKAKKTEKDAVMLAIDAINDKYKINPNSSIEVYEEHLNEIIKIAQEAGSDVVSEYSVRKTYIAQLKETRRIKLQEEITSIKGLDSRHLAAISLYLQTGDLEKLNNVSKFGSSETTDSIAPAIKSRIIEIKKELDDRRYFDANAVTAITETINKIKRASQQEEQIIYAAFEKSKKEAIDKAQLENALNLLTERSSVLFQIERISKDTEVNEDNINFMIEKRDAFLEKVKKNTLEKGSKVSPTFLNQSENMIDLTITKAVQNVMYEKIRKDVEENVSPLIFENNEFIVNPAARKKISNYIKFFRNNQDKSGTVPQEIKDFRKNVLDDERFFSPDSDDSLIAQLGKLQTELNANANAQKANADAKNLLHEIFNRTVQSSAKTSEATNDALFAILKQKHPNLVVSKDETGQLVNANQNLENFLLSKTSLEGGTLANTMYKFIADGYLPDSFVRIVNKASSLNNEQMGVLITHIQRLQHGKIPGTNFKGSAFGFRGARIEGGDHKFKEINDTINKLLAVAHISKLTGNVRETELVSNDWNPSMGSMPVEVEVTRSQPLQEIYNMMNQKTSDEIKQDYLEIARSLESHMPDSLKNSNNNLSGNLNHSAVIDGLIESTGLLDGGNIPDELRHLTDYLFRGYSTNKDNLDINEFYDEYELFLKDYLDQEYVESNGNILEFTNNGPKSFTRTRHGLEKYFNSPEKYSAAVEYINDLLPEGFIFDPETVVGGISSAFTNEQPQTFTSGFSISPTPFAANIVTEQDEEAIAIANKAKALMETAKGGRVVLVAYPTASAQETVYQAFVHKNGRLVPVNILDRENVEAPLVFSAQSLNNALAQDGRLDAQFRENIIKLREERRALIEKFQRNVQD